MKWRPLDVIILFIVASVVVLLLAINIGSHLTGRVLSDNGAQIVGGLLASFVAVVAVYVGKETKQDNEKEDDD